MGYEEKGISREMQELHLSRLCPTQSFQKPTEQQHITHPQVGSGEGSMQTVPLPRGGREAVSQRPLAKIQQIKVVMKIEIHQWINAESSTGHPQMEQQK